MLDYKQIQELIKLINKSEIGELKIEQGDFKFSIRTSSYTKGKQEIVAMNGAPSYVATAPSTIATTPSSPEQTKSTEEKPVEVSPTTSVSSVSSSNEKQIKSPMVGTFYRSPGPDKPLFVKVGDKVSKGQVVCIIEAMKLFNEIESDQEGTIIKVLVDDAQPVEFDQPLFIIG